jgi:predicted O-methyltransferase YrrM
MDSRISKSGGDFIYGLTGARSEEMQQYVLEFKQDKEFQAAIAEKRRASGRGSYYSIGASLGLVLYIICRQQKPDAVIETGVASGVSSSHILCALEKNSRGRLYSIDLPLWRDRMSGWLIPDYQRPRWNLSVGPSAEQLPHVLKKAGRIDIFLHDSDHTYENMTWEFETAWAQLKSGGILMAHNIDYGGAFADFCRNHKAQGYVLENLGGAVKK